MRWGRQGAGAALVVTVALGTASAQQDLSHHVPGSVGIHAGMQQQPGLYVQERILFYHAEQLVDRRGLEVPIQGFNLDAFANGVGVGGTWRLGKEGPYMGAGAAVPVARLSLASDRVEAGVDRFGLADLVVEPLQVGIRGAEGDAVASYSFNIPTGLGEVGTGAWSHEFSLGGALYFTDNRKVFVSALASYVLYQRNRSIDLTRGGLVHIQGGAGVTLFRWIDVGAAGYGLWQVADDRGSALPAVLRGARDQALGMGPEVRVIIPQIRMAVTARYERDLIARSRPMGQIFVLNLVWAAWQPRK